MTDRLSQLLHEEAAQLPTTTPDVASVTLAGRRLRRRERLATGLTTAAVLTLVVGAAAVVRQGLVDNEPDVVSLPRDVIVYGWQDMVHLDDVSVEVPGTVTAVDLTPSGVVVTTDTPDELILVRYDGSTLPLGPTSDESAVTTDPETDLFVHAVQRDDGVVVVVLDAKTGAVVRELPGTDRTGGGGLRPAVVLDGDTLYLAQRREGMFAINVVSGDRRTVDRVVRSIPAVRGGRRVVGDSRSYTVSDVETGELLLSVPSRAVADASLSYDGRWFLVSDQTRPRNGPVDQFYPPYVTVYDLESGREVVLDEADSALGWGWNVAGELYRVDAGEVVRCDPATGVCDRSPAPEPLRKATIPSLPGMPFA